MFSGLFKFFASLKLAVVSILTLAAVLAIATAAESNYGMRGAHAMVYGQWWFAGVLFLLGLNVLCAALSRFPWKRHQTGFVVTHLGIITILVGSWVTQKWGVDGNLPVTESQSSNDVLLNDMALSFYDEAGNLRASIPVPESATKTEGKLLEVSLAGTHKVVVDEYIPRLVAEKKVTQSPIGLGSPTLRVELFNSRFHVSEWLSNNHPEKPTELNLGPAILRLRKLWSEDEAQKFLNPPPPVKKNNKQKKSPGFLVVTDAGKDYRLSIEDALNRWTPLSGAALELKVEKYLPFAVVKDNELISRSNEPVNPAVQLLIRNPAGITEKHTIFARYPEFNTKHRPKDNSQPALGVKIRMFASSGEEDLAIVGTNRGQLQFAVSSDTRHLYYRSYGKEGDLKQKGEVIPGKPMPTGWMDLQFMVPEWYASAWDEEVPRYIEYISGGDNFLSGLHLTVDGKSDQARWLFEGAVQSVEIGGSNWLIQFSKQRLRLPFLIELKKFTIGTDPGTSKAASYSSDVEVKDVSKTSVAKGIISMNEPLKFGGYTFYQASYQMEEGKPPVSIFSVNYDPGRMVKYAGALLMVLGTLLMFYMNPHYWDKILGGKHA